MNRPSLLGTLFLCAALVGCGDDGEAAADPLACDAEPVTRTTSAGVDFVRTPDTCFEGLPGWPYAPRYVELDGLRQGYVDEGAAHGPVVLLLHGQPSWSYLYRKQAFVDCVPGAAGQPHDRLPEGSRFLQDEERAEMARRLATFFR